MKKLIALSALFMLLLYASPASSQNSEKITIGNVQRIHSKILNEDRKIWVYTPPDVQNGKAGGQQYPVLYLLDAEEHFFSTTAMVIQMSGRWPEMIVVGITNTNRDRDLKPSIIDLDGVAGKNSGGGGKFMSFIENELIPRIDSMYPTAPYRIFSGHSLGGLTVANTFLNNTRLFNAYVAIDPSLWWNKELLVEQAQRAFADKKFDNISLFIGRAKNMPTGMDTLKALKDTTQFTMLYRSVTRFLKVLKKSEPMGLRWTARYYPEEIHGTVELIGEYDALRFLFSFYQFRTSRFEMNPDLNIDSALTAHFRNASKMLGYKVKPSKNLVNNLGYTYMSIKKWDKAEFFFRLNIENYPLDANGYDSIGDYYDATGNIDKAIENFKKALTLGNDPGTKQKLDNLLNRK